MSNFTSIVVVHLNVVCYFLVISVIPELELVTFSESLFELVITLS